MEHIKKVQIVTVGLQEAEKSTKNQVETVLLDTLYIGLKSWKRNVKTTAYQKGELKKTIVSILYDINKWSVLSQAKLGS